MFHRQSNEKDGEKFTSDTGFWILAVLLNALMSNAADFLELIDILLQNIN